MRGITPRLAKRIHAGKRAELRLPVDREPLSTGHAYSLSRGERFLVLGSSEQMLHEITDDEAVRSGHANAEEFWDWWLETFKQGWGHRTHTSDKPAVVHTIQVYTVELDRSHRIRLLHKDSSHGYTENPYMAAVDEPEAVESRYLAKFAEDAEQIAGQQREIYQAAWDRQSLACRVAKLEADPSTSDHQLASLRKRVEQLEKRKQRKAA